ncbi:MAG TPA: MBL fold metallo-hydrolase [Chitinophagaceae bacterium]
MQVTPDLSYFRTRMRLSFSSLNSGSNGNCYYVGNDHDAVLIDAGISCREIEKRIKRLGLSMDAVRAIFVTHEHSDHITGIEGLCRKYRFPLYITTATLKASGITVKPELVQTFSPHQAVPVGSLSVTPFPKFHDASDPHSFVISGRGTTVGVFTDIGHACKQVTDYFRRCNAVFLEANYCEAMLAEGRYPWFLKSRISSESGHLSNHQALNLFLSHRGPRLTHLVLSHLSQNNNRPEIVQQLFAPHTDSIQLVVASRHSESALFSVADDEPHAVPALTPVFQQLSLF